MAFISATSITDIEFATVTGFDPVFNQKSYEDASRILAERETVSNIQERLIGLYKAKGFDVSPEAKTGKSNIFIGAVL